MINDIPTRQNLPEFIDRICASSRAYGIVKTIASWQSGLTLSSAIIGPLVGFAYPDYKAWGAFYAVIVLIIDVVFLEPIHTSFQTLGAKIQEMFDTDLMNIPWNTHKCNPRPDPEVLNGLANVFKKKEKTDRLVDWYPVTAGDVPIEYGRLICQRSNMSWDAALRRYYGVFFVVLMVMMLVVAGAVALILNWDASHIAVSLVLPLLPAGLKLFREFGKHRESANASERTKSILEGIWERGLTETVSSADFLHESRRLQVEIYDRRKGSPTVPQAIYFWLRDQYQDNMKFGADQMVKDAKAKVGIKP